MTIKERVALLVAGYSKKEIEQMEQAEKVEPEKVEPEKVESEKVEPEKVEPEKVESEKVEPEKVEPQIDYKKLYEESQKKLKEAQSVNNHTNNAANDISNEDYLEKLFTEFF